jgi:GNAT superfamily N-acetyltransferase
MPARFDPARRRLLIRYGAAAVSAAMALLYFGIGAGVLTVGDVVGPDAPDLVLFGASAGGAFALGAVLLVLVDHRGLWLPGALLQVMVIAMYVAVSSQRTPPFEVWGITAKVLQATILVALAYLVLRQPVRRSPMARRPAH